MTNSINNKANLRDQTQSIIEAKERFKVEATFSWYSYQTTGMHLSREEVQDWLSPWGTDRETEIPECHQ